jgi:nitrogen fixation protein NifU and related proteins
MSQDLGALYQEVILDHNRSPRNWGELEDASRRVNGHNPLCGDQLTLDVRFDGDVISELKFTGEGCAISKASASMMTQAVKGKTRAEAERLFERFHALVTGKDGGARSGSAAGPDASLGRLKVFEGVARFPTRVKCASLAWHALRAAIEGSSTEVSVDDV